MNNSIQNYTIPPYAGFTTKPTPTQIEFLFALLGAFTFFELVGSSERPVIIAGSLAGAIGGYILGYGLMSVEVYENMVQYSLYMCYTNPLTAVVGVVFYAALFDVVLAVFVAPEIEVLDSFISLISLRGLGVLSVAIGVVGMLFAFDVIGWPIQCIEWMFETDFNTENVEAVPPSTSSYLIGHPPPPPGSQRDEWLLSQAPVDFFLFLFATPHMIIQGIIDASNASSFAPITLIPFNIVAEQYGRLMDLSLDIIIHQL